MKREQLEWKGATHELELLKAVDGTIVFLTVNKTGGFGTYSAYVPLPLSQLRHYWNPDQPWKAINEAIQVNERFVQDRILISIAGEGNLIWHVDHRGPADNAVPADSLLWIPSDIVID